MLCPNNQSPVSYILTLILVDHDILRLFDSGKSITRTNKTFKEKIKILHEDIPFSWSKPAGFISYGPQKLILLGWVKPTLTISFYHHCDTINDIDSTDRYIQIVYDNANHQLDVKVSHCIKNNLLFKDLYGHQHEVNMQNWYHSSQTRVAQVKHQRPSWKIACHSSAYDIIGWRDFTPATTTQ